MSRLSEPREKCHFRTGRPSRNVAFARKTQPLKTLTSGRELRNSLTSFFPFYSLLLVPLVAESNQKPESKGAWLRWSTRSASCSPEQRGKVESASRGINTHHSPPTLLLSIFFPLCLDENLCPQHRELAKSHQLPCHHRVIHLITF